MKAGPTLKANEVQRAHKLALKEGRVTLEQAESIYWLYTFAVEKGLSNARVETLLGYKTSVSRIYKLEYEAKLDNICTKIDTLRSDQEIIEERLKFGENTFVENKIWTAIEDTCHSARISQTIASIWGDSQTGKSECLKRVAQLNPMRTTYIELDSGMTFREFLQLVARRLNSPHSGCIGSIRQGIYEALTPQSLLIFDELHKPLIASGKTTKIKIVEAIRDFHDKAGCGVVICGTNTLRDEFTSGMIAGVLKQTYKRGVIKVQCPPVLPLKEIWKFSDSYDLPRPAKGSDEHKLVQRINTVNGIGMLTKYLRDGSRLAANRKTKYTWKHFIETHDILLRYSHDGWWND